MSLPFTTTTCTIETSNGAADKWEAQAFTTSSTGNACVISLNDTDDITSTRGQRATTEATLFVDRSVTVTKDSRITDEIEGTVYLVVWVADRVALGLDRREAGLRFADGV